MLSQIILKSQPPTQENLDFYSTDVEALRQSVGSLLSSVGYRSCLAAAQAYANIVPQHERFRIALDTVLPQMTSGSDYALRILSSFILFSLYTPHPISMNPFRSIILEQFLSHRAVARTHVNINDTHVNEQFIWVLWKILRGEGSDIGPYSPAQLAREPLHPQMRAAQLTLIEETNISTSASSASTTVSRSSTPPLQSPRPTLVTRSSDHYPTYGSSENAFNNSSLINRSASSYEGTSKAISLLLSARSRVLTLSEQRILRPHLQSLVHPLPILKAPDLPALITHNPMIAHPFLVWILQSSMPQAAQKEYVDEIKSLPPTLSSFDFIGRLVMDQTPLGSVEATYYVADVIVINVLAGFVHGCIEWIEREEREIEMTGKIDDKLEKAIINLCRFYSSLVKSSVIDVSDDDEITEMKHFALQNSRFEEANTLFRVLAKG
ncbi:hypothetical protein SISNIDRAFT_483622 [Sistotremastrum niveocremeum HHB9708]|uniref:CCR4-NOT transcription complex subunit 11 n=1 Tax=Sistotremastrum niveocremeum HHB9708 TaxID=1314777 RepID=A0A164WUY8_9AGAM|nr:hypothetical protein SISNIDRAFT_483622 [Sistotremastrum niveocremeum HHB9708]